MDGDCININTNYDDSDPKVIEWEEVDEKDEEASKGELKENCEKLKKVPDYHNRMIPLQKVLDPNMSTESISQQYPQALSKDDYFFKFLKEQKAEIRKVADAVVKLRVRKIGKVCDGTGFVVAPRPPGYDKNTENSIFEFAVLTNFHNIKLKSNDTSDNQVVNPKDIEVHFFYDSEAEAERVTCKVSQISSFFSVNRGNNSTVSPERLDFAFLYIEHPDDVAKKIKLEHLHTLGYEETARVQQLPKDAPVCIIGHPHGAYKHIAFGKLTTCPELLWREWDPAKAMHSVEYEVATCGGSSGSPVFLLANGLLFVPFIHFQADSKSGDAVSMQTILPNVRKMVVNHGNPQN